VKRVIKVYTWFSLLKHLVDVSSLKYTVSCFSRKRQFDAGYGRRFGVVNDVGSKLMGI